MSLDEIDSAYMKLFRISAILLIALFGASLWAEKSEEELIGDLKSGDPVLQSEASKKLGSKKSKAAVGDLVSLLQNTTSSEVGANAAAALGEIGEKGAATDALVGAVKDSDDTLIRYAGVAALANLKDKDKKDAIVEACNAASESDDEFLKDLSTKVSDIYSK